MTEKFIPQSRSAILGNVAKVASIVLIAFTQTQFVSSSFAQSSGAVPATCAINAGNSTMTCTTTVALTGITGNFTGGTLTLSGSGTQPPTGVSPTCTAITPGSQTVSQNAAAAALNANCTGATSYQWYTGSSPANGVAIAGATGATFTPSTAATGASVYSVRATNTTGSTDNSAAATVTVQAVIQPPVTGGTCASGNPRVIVNFTKDAQNFTYQSIVGSGSGSLNSGQGTHVTQITVGPTSTDTTLNHRYTATWGIVQDDTTTFSNRTVSLSQTCGDFSPDKIVFANTPSGNFALVTRDDAARADGSTLVVTPGVWYINVRNDDCPAGTNCSITGIYTNRNR
jgi:hypothetical protein